MKMKIKTGQKCHNCGKVFWDITLTNHNGILMNVCEYCNHSQPYAFAREYVLDENDIAIGELEREESIAQ